MRLDTFLPATLVVVSGWGCRGLDATAHDLRALHTPDGAVQYRARVVGGLGFSLGNMDRVPRSDLDAWVMRAAYPEDLPGEDLVFHPHADARETRVDRPQVRTLARLRALDDYRAEGRPYTAGVQVELAAFLAVDSRAKLVRERAVRILGDAALRLKLTGVSQSPDRPEPDEAVRARFEQLAAAVARFEAERDPVPLSAIVDGFDGAPLALADWRRALRVTTSLLDSLGERRWREAGLDRLHRLASQACVSLALGDALRDESGFVAGAAAEELLRFDRSRLFELLSESSERGRWRLVAACLRSIVDRGLPSEEPPLDVWLERLVLLGEVIDSSSIADDQVRLLSAQALGRVAPGGFQSLRWEDWVRWYWRYSGRILSETLRDGETGATPEEQP